MLPPGFVRNLADKGLAPPLCRYCIHFAAEKGTGRSVCVEYGAVVLLSSSCQSFEQRVGSSTPDLDAEEIRERFRFGPNALTK